MGLLAGTIQGQPGQLGEKRGSGVAGCFHWITRLTPCLHAAIVNDLHAQLADHQQLAVVDADVDLGRRTFTMHDDRHAKLLRELSAGRKMVGMGVGVDDVAQTQGVTGGQSKIAVDLTHLGIDHRGGAGVGATDQVGLAAAGCDLLKNHLESPRVCVTGKAIRTWPSRPA